MPARSISFWLARTLIRSLFWHFTLLTQCFLHSWGYEEQKLMFQPSPTCHKNVFTIQIVVPFLWSFIILFFYGILLSILDSITDFLTVRTPTSSFANHDHFTVQNQHRRRKIPKYRKQICTRTHYYNSMRYIVKLHSIHLMNFILA